ncbi:MAG: RCC1 domain-containing protein [Ilumatobacteraceae bacterium]
MALAVPVLGATSAAAATEVGFDNVVNGYYHTCAITPSGTVKCWGLNDTGQLSSAAGGATSTNVPVQVPGLTNVVDLALGHNHTCALTRPGRCTAGEQQLRVSWARPASTSPSWSPAAASTARRFRSPPVSTSPAP